MYAYICVEIFLFLALAMQNAFSNAYELAERGLETSSATTNMIITTPPIPSFTRVPTLAKRLSTASTCGDYLVDNFTLPLYADQQCLVDYSGLFFGACAGDITNAVDCGWAEICVDSHACTSTCGRTSVPNLSTTTCSLEGMDKCATWYLVTDTYVFTSMLCSSKQSWTTFTATYDPSMTHPDTGMPPVESSTKTSTPASTTSGVSTTSTTSNPTSSPSPKNTATAAKSSKTAAAIGGSVGGVGLVLLILAGAWFYRRYKRTHKPLPTTEPASPTTEHPISPELDGGATRFEKSADDVSGTGKKGIMEDRVVSAMSEMDAERPIQEMHNDVRPVELPA